jgi:hypothetical protein
MNIYAKELHKPVKKHFKRLTVPQQQKDYIWTADLVDMQEWSKKNKGYKYILTVIDIGTRYAWAKPLKSKYGTVVTNAFRSLLKQRHPKLLWVDQGSEFYNKNFKELAKKYKIEIYSTYSSSHKSTYVERFNKTLKTRMWEYFTQTQTRKWYDILKSLVRNYNESKHSKIKMSPTEASKHQIIKVKKVEKPISDTNIINRKHKFDLDDKVRIARQKGTFEKGYLPNWSQEIFTIDGINLPAYKSQPVTYTVMDHHHNHLKGVFYTEELQKTKLPDFYLVEKVVKKRGNRYLVKWQGFSSKENSWITKSQFEKFKQK